MGINLDRAVPEGAGRSDEIEVTPEMIQAGLRVLIRLADEDSELCVREILREGFRLSREGAEHK